MATTVPVPVGLAAGVIVDAAELVAVPDEDPRAIGRERDAVRLPVSRRAPAARVTDQSRVSTTATRLALSAVTKIVATVRREGRLERPVRHREPAQQARRLGFGEVEDQERVGQLRGDRQQTPVGRDRRLDEAVRHARHVERGAPRPRSTPTLAIWLVPRLAT